MEFPKIVLGLKAEKTTSNFIDDSSDDGNFFDDSSDDQDLHLLRKKPSLFTKTITEDRQKVVEFTDVSSRVTPICTALKDYKIPEKKFEKVVLIPENILTEGAITEINNFIEGRTNDLELTDSQFDDVFAAQFEILKYYREKEADLESYAVGNVDSRILSILHFCIAKKSTNQQSQLYHYLSSIEEAVKIPQYAPITLLFPEYGINELLELISKLLIDLFPKHPILPSLLHSLAEFNPNILHMLDELENASSMEVSAEQSDDDDDSFFEFIRKRKSRTTSAPQVCMLIEDTVENPLDFPVLQTKQDTLAVSVTAPPETMTYFLDEKEEKVTFSATQFSDWIISMRDAFSKTVQPANPHKKRRVTLFNNPNKGMFLTTPSPGAQQPKESTFNMPPDLSNPHYYTDLYDKLDNGKKKLPNDVNPEYFHLFYPILHIVNVDSVRTCGKEGTWHCELIKLEKIGHNALLQVDSDILKPLDGLIKFIPKDLVREPILPLEKKRALPVIDMKFDEDVVVGALAAADIEMLINGRSPLTGARVSAPPTTNLREFPILSRKMRASYLYNIYSKMELPPYFALRIGFAAALALMEMDAGFSCRIMFELVYMMHNVLRGLVRAPLFRNAILFFAETLERSDRYFHACLVFDNYFLSDVNDSSSAASAIAQIAQRNGDTVRAAFFYTESIKQLVQEGKYDESLYLGQIVAQIYVDNGLLHLALSVLSYLLKNTYPIRVYEPKKGNQENPHIRGTLRVSRHTITLDTPNFKPSKESINTMLVCCSYIDILIRCKMCKTANETLKILEDSMDTPLLQSVTSYLRSRILVRSNRYDIAIKTLPNFTLKNQQRTATHISLLSGTSFDSSTAILKMMAKATINMLLYRECIVWSEIIIQSKSSLREIGSGFLWRGMSYNQALTNSHLLSEEIDFRTELSPPMNKFVHYVPKVRKYNEREIAIEAISSFFVARSCFEKVGAIKKETQAALMYVDTALCYFFDPYDPGTPREDLIVTQPILETEMNKSTVKHETVKIQEHVITYETCADEMSRILNFAEKNAGRIMCPVLITYGHALQAKINMMKNNMSLAKTYFDFAYSTIKKYSCGSRFSIKTVSASILASFEHIIDLLCDMLVAFESSYINDHLVLFDILSDLRSYISNKSRTVSDGSVKAVVADIDMDGEALTLNNPRLPSFLPVLKTSGYLRGGKEDDIEHRNTTFNIQFRMISSNIRLFETGKLSEELMHMRNKQCCFQIEKLASLSSSMNRNSIIIDARFQAMQKHSTAIQRTILIQRILHGIFVYVPSTGQKNIMIFKATPKQEEKKLVPKDKKKIEDVKATLGKNMKVINFKTNDKEYTLPIVQGVVPKSFYKVILDLVLVDKKIPKDHFSRNSTTKNVLNALKNQIFGDLLETCKIFKAKAPSVKDMIPELDNKFFANKKGKLATIEPGLISSINFIVSSELRSLPLELMFNKSLVVRVPCFASLIEMRPEHPPYDNSTVRGHVFRTMLPKDVLRSTGLVRSTELFKYITWSFGSGETTKEYVPDNENTLPYPFALFSSNKSTSYYENEYAFCNFQEITSSSKPILPKSNSKAPTLFIFTYTDLCSCPSYVDSLMDISPYSFFMFIPSSSIRKAFQIMSDVHERHLKRIELNIPLQKDLIKRPEKFIAALQLTLIRELHVPIPIILPILK